MEKIKWIKSAGFLIINLSSINLFTANAQRLPNVQLISVYAPANIKIDGKATEWGNGFLAHNHATDISYTLSNDDSHLYLTLQADEFVGRKILFGGVAFTISPSHNKKDKDNVTVIFPVFDRKDVPSIDHEDKIGLTKDTALNRMRADSFMHVINKRLTDRSKYIKVSGIKAIPDSSISIYNEYGIKAAALFNNQVKCTYELAIPLKYLGLSTEKFLYHIELEGASANHSKIQLSRNGAMYQISSGGNQMFIAANSQYSEMIFATDFWGEYTLAKKP